MAKSSVMELRADHPQDRGRPNGCVHRTLDRGLTGARRWDEWSSPSTGQRPRSRGHALLLSRRSHTVPQNRPWSRARSKATNRPAEAVCRRSHDAPFLHQCEGGRGDNRTRKADEVCWINMLTPQPGAGARVFSNLSVGRTSDTGHGPQGAGWRRARSAASSMYEGSECCAGPPAHWHLWVKS